MIMILVKIWKLDLENWNVLDVFLCILGSPLNVGLTYKERIFYLVPIFVSMYANNDMLAKYELDVVFDVVEAEEQLEKTVIESAHLFDHGLKLF